MATLQLYFEHSTKPRVLDTVGTELGWTQGRPTDSGLEWSIGRHGDIVFLAPSISRVHAKISYQESYGAGIWRITHLGTNQTVRSRDGELQALEKGTPSLILSGDTYHFAEMQYWFITILDDTLIQPFDFPEDDEPHTVEIQIEPVKKTPPEKNSRRRDRDTNQWDLLLKIWEGPSAVKDGHWQFFLILSLTLIGYIWLKYGQ